MRLKYYIATLFLINSPMIISMQSYPKITKYLKKVRCWKKNLAHATFDTAILGKIPHNSVEIKTLLIIPNNPYPFNNLSDEKQYSIMSLLITGTYTHDFELAAGTISSLSLVNKQLNQTFNHPLYCFKIINCLSHTFNISHEKVCQTLQLPKARTILKNQLLLKNICDQTDTSDLKKDFYDEYIPLMKNGANLNFTYGPSNRTLLIFAIILNKSSLVDLLLQDGADPELIGKRPLSWAKKYENNDIIRLLEDAIDKKYSQRE